MELAGTVIAEMIPAGHFANKCKAIHKRTGEGSWGKAQGRWLWQLFWQIELRGNWIPRSIGKLDSRRNGKHCGWGVFMLTWKAFRLDCVFCNRVVHDVDHTLFSVRKLGWESLTALRRCKGALSWQHSPRDADRRSHSVHYGRVLPAAKKIERSWFVRRQVLGRVEG